MFNYAALYAPYTPLQAHETMSPNMPCWCASGQKWKKCHRNRADQKPVNEHMWFGEFNRANATGECQHPDAPAACSGPAISSHTIQRALSLEAIAQNGKVYSRRDLFGRGNQHGHPRLIGLKKASTFPGFCSHHDGITFRVIDTLGLVDTRAAFLLSYRSLCFEVHMKKTAADTLRHYRGYIDRGMSFEQQKNSQNSIAEQLYYFEIGLQEHQKRKKEWDILLCNKNYHSFDFSAIELPPNFPMLGSGTFFHEYDFSGQLLQPPGKYLHKYDLLAFNMARSPNALWLVFGWMKSEPSGARFVESLAALKSDDLHEAVMRFCWETTDNLFINPIWWDSKNESDKETLIRFGQASLPGERTRDALVPNGADAFRI